MSTDNRRSLNSIHLLRAVCLILITYDHLIPGYYATAYNGNIPVTLVEKLILWPCAIINHFGFLGIVIFLMISGYISLFSAQNPGANTKTYIIKRVFRIIPPLLYGMALYYIAYFLIERYCGFPLRAYHEFNGPLWTLMVQGIYYVMEAFFYPVMKKNQPAAVVLFTAVTSAICVAGMKIGSLVKFGGVASYLFYLLLGAYLYTLVYCDLGQTVWGKIYRILMPIYLWCGIVFFNIAVYFPEGRDTGNSYGVSAMYAILIFCLCISNEQRIKTNRFIMFWSKHSYSIYIHQVPVLNIAILLFAGTHDIVMITCITVIVFAISMFYDEILDKGVTAVMKKCLALVSR